MFIAPCAVVLSAMDVVQPDLLYLASEHASQVTATHIQGTPDLVIEILSENTRRMDEGLKRKLYERAGVREYGWSTRTSNASASIGASARPTRGSPGCQGNTAIP